MRAKYDWDTVFAWLLGVVRSLPYRPSLRWSFYRCLDRFGMSKDDWSVFKDANARFRYQGRSGWRRDTLADSVRRVEYRGHAATNRASWLKDLLENASPVGVWDDLDTYVECWFESEAMAGQFDHYLGEPFQITTRPFRGDYTIPMKDEAATTLRWSVQSGKRATVLYFGDADRKGAQIPKTAVEDIREWSGVEFTFRHGGLAPEQAIELGLPENPDRPGVWQWDALSDKQAREMILGVLAEEVEVERLAAAVADAREKQANWVREARQALGLPEEGVGAVTARQSQSMQDVQIAGATPPPTTRETETICEECVRSHSAADSAMLRLIGPDETAPASAGYRVVETLIGRRMGVDISVCHDHLRDAIDRFTGPAPGDVVEVWRIL